VLLVDLLLPDADAGKLARELGLELLPLGGAYFADRAQEVRMAVVILPEGSGLVGRSLVRSAFRSRYGLTAVGLKRGSRARSRGSGSRETY